MNNKMETNYGILISEIPTNLKNKLRKYERCLKKINTTIWSVEFNSTCINEGILPNYSKFKQNSSKVRRQIIFF